MSARARQHFTLLKQVNQLIEAAEGEPEIGFMARLLALCSLPRTNPRDRLQYVRRNGPYTLGMSAGINNKLPYGNIPRLLLAWVCSEAVRTQSRDLVLGRSLYEFMHKLGMEDRSGGRHGERARLKNQMDRLFTSSVQLVYAADDHKVVVSSLPMTRKRDQPIEPTPRTSEPREASAERATSQKVTKLSFHEAGEALPVAEVGRLRQKRLKVFEHHLVQDARAASVGRSSTGRPR